MSDPYGMTDDPYGMSDPQGHDPRDPSDPVTPDPQGHDRVTRDPRDLRDLRDRFTPWVIAALVIFTLMLTQRIMAPRPDPVTRDPDPVTPTVTVTHQVTPDPVVTP
jgi:hypothetical protein